MRLNRLEMVGFFDAVWTEGFEGTSVDSSGMVGVCSTALPSWEYKEEEDMEGDGVVAVDEGGSTCRLGCAVILSWYSFFRA